MEVGDGGDNFSTLERLYMFLNFLFHNVKTLDTSSDAGLLLSNFGIGRLLDAVNMIVTLREYLLEVILRPTELRGEASELPNAADLLIPVLVVAVSVALG